MFWDKSTKGKQTMNQTTKKNHKNISSWEKRRAPRWKWEKAERGNFNTIVKEAGRLFLDKNVS